MGPPQDPPSTRACRLLDASPLPRQPRSRLVDRPSTDCPVKLATGQPATFTRPAIALQPRANRVISLIMVRFQRDKRLSPALHPLKM